MNIPNWNKLPNEILLKIFKYNDDSTNNQCSLTCHDWKYAAQCILFGRIAILTEEKFDFLSKTLSIYHNNSHDVDFGQSPGNYVKIVDCRYLSNEFDLESLDKLFPFIEAIETNQNMGPFHDELYRLLKEGKFSHLKILPTNQNNRPPPELILQRKETIEQLQLDVTTVKDHVLHSLHLFPELKVIKLEYPQIIHLEHFIPKEIPQLKAISLKFTKHLRNMDTSMVEVNDIQPFLDVREMQIEYYRFCHDDDSYLLYIMKKFPHLDALELADTRQIIDFGRQNNFGKCTHEVPTMGCVFQFLVYLFKMKFSNVICMITDSFTTQVIKKFLSYVTDQRAAGCENMNVSLLVKLHHVTPGQEHTYSPDRTAYIGFQSQRIGFKHFKRDVCYLSVMYKVMQETTFQSHLELIREVENMDIEYLRIENSSEHFVTNVPVILDDIFSHSLKLKHISFDYINDFIWTNEDHIEAGNNSNIEVISFSNCILSEDIFPMISQRCKNLRCLDLGNYQITNNNGGQDNRIFSVVLPSSRLQQLRILIDNRFETFSYKKVFIRLITNNKKPRYCKTITDIQPPIISFPEQDYTEAHYKLCLDDEECAVFDIHCEAAVKFVVNVETDFYEGSEYNTWDSDYEVDEEHNSYKEKIYIEEDL